MEKIPLKDVLPINKNMNSAQENTMVSTLGSPKLPLTTNRQDARASDIVKSALVSEKITDILSLRGLRPAMQSAKDTLSRRCSRTFPDSMRS